MKQQAYLVDTNVIIRYLIGDLPEQEEQVVAWFERAKRGELTLVLLPMVVAEVAYVLESYFQRNRTEISSWLTVFVGQRWLKVVDRSQLVMALSHYQFGQHFVDSYLLSNAEIHSYGILSFDKKISSSEI